jgi:hypothetical protein
VLTRCVRARQCCSIDLEGTWHKYAELLLGSGLDDQTPEDRFIQWDVNDGCVDATIEANVAKRPLPRPPHASDDEVGQPQWDFIVISYVLEMYMSEDKHCRMMADWLHDGVRAIIISSRSPTLEAADKMKELGCSVVPLLMADADASERDERQTLFVLPSTLAAMNAAVASPTFAGSEVATAPVVFPNVPETHKAAEQADPSSTALDIEVSATAAQLSEDAASVATAAQASAQLGEEGAEVTAAGGGGAATLNHASGGSGPEAAATVADTASPGYTPASPGYTPASPGYTPVSPGYTPASPGADSTACATASPGYTPASPGYTPASPGYTPASPGA